MRLGIIARSDNTGLGNQTRELVKMLNPDKILLIDSSHFNQNRQHPEWYKGFNVLTTKNGFPSRSESKEFLYDLDAVLTCETFYYSEFIDLARSKNVKTILQYNYEFLEHMRKQDIPIPDVFLAPSHWNTDKVDEIYGNRCKVAYLPPPTDPELFKSARENNMSTNHKRLLHIAGRTTTKDRNGTESIIKMLRYSSQDYLMVIKTQSRLSVHSDDPRLIVDASSPEDRETMYDGFDAMIMPRRYGGLCLPMNEALMSGLPVFMTDISPNVQVLPKNWLIESGVIDHFRARVMIDVYNANPRELAEKVDQYVRTKNKEEQKTQAFELGLNNFSPLVLKEKYLKIINE